MVRGFAASIFDPVVTCVIAKERCGGGDYQKSTFARLSGLLDFRLLQQYLPQAGIVPGGTRRNHIRLRQLAHLFPQLAH